jgi:hypothetical protein
VRTRSLSDLERKAGRVNSGFKLRHYPSFRSSRIARALRFCTARGSTRRRPGRRIMFGAWRRLRT